MIVNLDTGEVLDLLPNRTKAELMAYFQAMGKLFCESIEVFCSDMWDGYIETAKAIFPNAAIIVDRFHFFSHLQKVVDAVRKQLRKKYPKIEELKKIKWLLLKNVEALSPAEKQQLEQLWQNPHYKLLQNVYEAKNNFREILEKKLSPQKAESKFKKWIEKAQALNYHPMDKFIDLFNRWKKYILNYFKFRLSTGIIEGINNKIKLIKRRAFGFTFFPNFRRIVLIEFIKS